MGMGHMSSAAISVDIEGRTVLMPAERSALWPLTWHFKSELGVQFVAKDAVGHLP